MKVTPRLFIYHWTEAFFRIASIAQNENLETPDILKSLKMSYFFQVVEDSTYVCKKNDLNSLKSNKTQINQFS